MRVAPTIHLWRTRLGLWATSRWQTGQGPARSDDGGPGLHGAVQVDVDDMKILEDQVLEFATEIQVQYSVIHYTC